MQHTLNDSKVLINQYIFRQISLLATRETIYNVEWLCENFRIVNPLAPNDVYIRRTAQLTSRLHYIYLLKKYTY